MREKGQAVIEFLLIFIAVFTITSSFVYPQIGESGREDFVEGEELLKVSNAAEGIASRINRLAPGGEYGRDSFRIQTYHEWDIIFRKGELLIDSAALDENIVADLDYSFSEEEEISPGSYWVEVMKTREESDNIVVDDDEIIIRINPWGDED